MSGGSHPYRTSMAALLTRSVRRNRCHQQQRQPPGVQPPRRSSQCPSGPEERHPHPQHSAGAAAGAATVHALRVARQMKELESARHVEDKARRRKRRLAEILSGRRTRARTSNHRRAPDEDKQAKGIERDNTLHHHDQRRRESEAVAPETTKLKTQKRSSRLTSNPALGQGRRRDRDDRGIHRQSRKRMRPSSSSSSTAAAAAAEPAKRKLGGTVSIRKQKRHPQHDIKNPFLAGEVLFFICNNATLSLKRAALLVRQTHAAAGEAYIIPYNWRTDKHVVSVPPQLCDKIPTRIVAGCRGKTVLNAPIPGGVPWVSAEWVTETLRRQQCVEDVHMYRLLSAEENTKKLIHAGQRTDLADRTAGSGAAPAHVLPRAAVASASDAEPTTPSSSYDTPVASSKQSPATDSRRSMLDPSPIARASRAAAAAQRKSSRFVKKDTVISEHMKSRQRFFACQRPIQGGMSVEPGGKEKGIDVGKAARISQCSLASGSQNRPTVAAIASNSLMAKILSDMAEQYDLKPEKREHIFKAQNYRKAANAVLNCEKELKNEDDIRQLALEKGNGLQSGGTIEGKLIEILQTGRLRVLEEMKRNPLAQAMSAFMKIHGVGAKTAAMWARQGYTTVEDLKRNHVKLSHGQKMGIKYLDDVQYRIPRAEVRALGEAVIIAAKRVYGQDAEAVVCGSYRRGAETSGDCDVLITHPRLTHTRAQKDSRQVAQFLRLLRLLSVKQCAPAYGEEQEERDGAGQNTKGDIERIIVDEISHSQEDFPLQFMGYARLSLGHAQYSGRVRRLDIKVYPVAQFPFALLYFTGDSHFNRSQRWWADVNGYKLNDKGLFTRAVAKLHGPVTGAHSIACASERDIFSKLGMQWREPNERITVVGKSKGGTVPTMKSRRR